MSVADQSQNNAQAQALAGNQQLPASDGSVGQVTFNRIEPTVEDVKADYSTLLNGIRLGFLTVKVANTLDLITDDQAFQAVKILADSVQEWVDAAIGEDDTDPRTFMKGVMELAQAIKDDGL
jgi:hypothetical protein